MNQNSIRKSFLMLCVLFVSAHVFAQDNSAKKDNLVKISPLKLLNPLSRGVNLGYERVIGNQSTLSLNAKFIVHSDLTKLKLEDDPAIDGTSVIKGGNIKGITITPEYRYYFSEKKGATQGFYFDPFLRYFHYGADPQITYTNGDGVSQIDSRLTFRGIGGGLGFGVQKVWDGGFVLDWNLGIGGASSKATYTGNITGPLSDNLQDFIDELNSSVGNYPFIKAELTNNGTKLDASTSNFGWPILRSNLSVGWSF